MNTVLHIGIWCFIVLGAVLVCFKKTQIFGKIVLSIGLFVEAAAIALLSMLYFALGEEPDIYGHLAAALVMLIYVFIFLCIFRFIQKKAVWIPYLCLWPIFIITFLGAVVYNAYESSVPVMVDRDCLLSEYAPFDASSEVAVLDGKASLSLTEDLPVMDGATALYPIYSAFARAVYPEGEDRNVRCGGTTNAYTNIVDGMCDIAFLAAPSEKQLEYAKSRGVELELTPIGYEAFVFFVNSKNPIEELSVSQIKDIYAGRTTKWSELGVRGLGKIQAFQRDEGSGSQSALLRLMEDDTLMQAPQNVISSMGGIITETADYKNYKNAIGFSFRFYSSEMVASNQIKLLKLDGVYPNRENIESGSYPITNNFYMVTRKGDVSEQTQALMDWILSEQGMELIDKTGYTPVK